MMTKKQKLYTLRNDPNVHYNCAQSMLIPFAGEIGITEEQANALTLNFGGGMGCGAACGALVGTLAAMGGLGMPQEKREELIAEFQSRHQCLNCRRGWSGELRSRKCAVTPSLRAAWTGYAGRLAWSKGRR